MAVLYASTKPSRNQDKAADTKIDQEPGRESDLVSRRPVLRKPNYSHEKRQREIAKQKKREAKRRKKNERADVNEEKGSE